jgi:hypothetical protein
MADLVARALEARTRPSATPVEEMLLAIILQEGAVPLRALVPRVARRLYATKLRQWGWATEIGLLGSAAFVPEVNEALTEADQALWRIEPAPPAGPSRTTA